MSEDEAKTSEAVAAVRGYAPAIYMDDHAEQLKPRAGQPYRPSNGTEGDYFQALWCGRCKREAAFRADRDGQDGCSILSDTMFIDRDEPGYPREWQYSTSGQPLCTAWEADETQLAGAQP